MPRRRRGLHSSPRLLRDYRHDFHFMPILIDFAGADSRHCHDTPAIRFFAFALLPPPFIAVIIDVYFVML